MQPEAANQSRGPVDSVRYMLFGNPRGTAKFALRQTGRAGRFADTWRLAGEGGPFGAGRFGDGSTESFEPCANDGVGALAFASHQFEAVAHDVEEGIVLAQAVVERGSHLPMGKGGNLRMTPAAEASNGSDGHLDSAFMFDHALVGFL